MKAPMPQISRDLKILELFSGSFGGWKGAADRIHETTDFCCQTVSVDHDFQAAKTFSMTHGTNLLKGTNHLMPNLFASSPEDWMVISDVLDDKLHHAFAQWGPQLATVSSPCPPWSRSGRGGGFSRLDGLLLLRVLMFLRLLQVTFILVEQVASIVDHSHFEALQLIIHWLGYRIVWQRVADLQDISKVARPRWLALLERIHAQIPAAPGQIWKRVARALLPDPRLPLPMDHLLSMRIDAEVYRIASDPEYMKFKGKSIGTALRDIDILGLRTYQGGTIPCFMARYGTQHMLDDAMLRSQGFHCHFAPHADFPEGCRYWLPAEIAVMHGICKPTWLPDDHFQAWFGLGNQISIPHALLAFVNALSRCFEPKLNLEQVLLDFASHRYGPQGLQFIPMAKGYMICPKDAQFHPGFLEAVTQIDKYLEANEPQFWSPKHGILDLNQAHWTLHSAVSPGSTSAAEDVALEFQQLSPVFPGRIFFEDHCEDFWFSGKIPGDCIRAVWDSQFQCTFHEATQPIMLELHLQPLDFGLNPDNDSCVVSLLDQELTLIFCAPNALAEQEHIRNLGQDLFDQFGALDSTQQPAHDTMLLSTPLTFDDPQIDFVHLLGAFKELQIQWNFAITTNTLTCHLSGSPVNQEIWGKFWTSLLSPFTQQQLGRSATFDAETGTIYFRPQTKELPRMSNCALLLQFLQYEPFWIQ